MPHPCEDCTPRLKITILVESGELAAPHPCEGCTPRLKEHDFNIQNRSKTFVLRLGWGTPHEGGFWRYSTHSLLTQAFSVLPSITFYYAVLPSTTLYYQVIITYFVLHNTSVCYPVLVCTTQYPCKGCTPRLKIVILAESGELRVPHPCEGCTPRLRIAILAESGKLRVPHPCEGCAPRLTIAILAESGKLSGELRVASGNLSIR